jgi:hypothetical protein
MCRGETGGAKREKSKVKKLGWGVFQADLLVRGALGGRFHQWHWSGASGRWWGARIEADEAELLQILTGNDVGFLYIFCRLGMCWE